MVAQASKHLTVVDLKTDHVRPLLKDAMNEIKQAQEELPEKEKINKDFAEALKLTTMRLNTVKENGETARYLQKTTNDNGRQSVRPWWKRFTSNCNTLAIVLSFFSSFGNFCQRLKHVG